MSDHNLWVRRGVCLAAVGWCGVVLAAHWFAGTTACAWDTSYCALSHHKNGVYRGVLADPMGGAPPNASFTVTFESRRDADPRDVGGFSTDTHGSYCIVWALERITPFAHIGGADRRIDGHWQPLRGVKPAPSCQRGDQGIPWNRGSDLKSSPQFASVFAVALPTMGLLLIGLWVPRGRVALLVCAAGLALTVATTLLAAILWQV
jgi:hypothetical protein